MTMHTTLTAPSPALIARIVATTRHAVRRVAIASGREDPAMLDPEWRMAAMIDAARAPESCGPEIVPAPARGPLRVWTPTELRPLASVDDPQPGLRTKGLIGDYQSEHMGYRGRDAARRVDVFDLMEDQARAAWSKGGRDAPFVPPFTPGQVMTARYYRDLTERHDAGGMRCASLETAGRGGSRSGGEFIDAFVHEGRVLAAMHRRIGSCAAMTVRRVRPSKRGGVQAVRSLILDRVLVDRVCLRGQSLSEVLEAFGWAVKGDHRERLRLALQKSLDRMAGY